MSDDLQAHVAEALKRRGLSARAAAELANREAGEHVISNQAINNFLNGTAPPTTKVRRGLALALEWPIDWPESPPPLPLSEVGQDAVETILSVIVSMSDAHRAVLENIDSRLSGIERHLKRAVSVPKAPRDKQAGD